MKGIESINKLAYTPNNTNLERMLEKIASENAILFTGAGFSFGSRNIEGTEPPTVESLTNTIAEEGGFNGENNLKLTANYFLKMQGDKKLIDILSKLYTITDISPAHEKILSIPWRRIYTTNYDNIITLAMRKNGIAIKNITPNDSPLEYFKEDNVCVHINGSIESLKTGVIPDSFKLTTSSYLSPDSFITSKWYSSFKKDLERASAIVFVGYSLYDIEIQKILFESPEFKEKTFFIDHESASPLSLDELSGFGKVYTIGVDGFANELEKNLLAYKKDPEAFYVEAFCEYRLEKNTQNIRDENIIEFMLHGNIDNYFIDEAITSHQKSPYVVVREQLQDIINLFDTYNYIAILSDFGNGKTIFLQEIMSYLKLNGKKVFELIDADADYARDLELLNSLNSEIFLILDNYDLYTKVLENLLLLNNQNFKVILSTRSTNHSQSIQIMDNPSLVAEVNIDLLRDEEINQLNSILEKTGLWAERAGLSEAKRFKILHDNNKSQFSHTLLNILNAPQMKDRIQSLLNSIFIEKDNKDTILAICILEIMNMPLTYTNISEVSLNNSIYNTKLINDKHFKQLFPSKNNKIISKSSLYARNLLTYHFNPIETVDKLLKIVEKFHDIRNNSEFETKIYKSLLRFAFIERVVPVKNKRDMLIRYYEQLKNRLRGLDQTPHFWLQYAMARIALDDYHNAQNYLDTAYSKAYQEYDTAYLDAQQSRLWIKLSLKELDQNKGIEYFKKAHNLLKNLYDDQYKYRQVEAYLDYYENKYSILSKKNKAFFLASVREMHNRLKELQKGYVTESNRMDHCYNKLNFILEECN